MQRFAPERVEVGASVLFLPVGLYEIVSREAGLAREDGNDLVRALAAVERLNERLNDADRSIVGAGVAPGLEIMRLRHMPMAKLGGLVAMRAEK